MSDTTLISEPAQEAEETQPAEAAPTTTEETTTQDRAYTAAEYRQVQNEARNLRARLRETETQQRTVATEAEQLRSQLSALSDELRGYRLRTALSDLGKDEAFSGLDVELVAKLVQPEWGSDGKPKGLNAAVKALIEKHPNLRTQAQPQAPRIPAQPSGNSAPRSAAAVREQLIEEKRRSGEYQPL